MEKVRTERINFEENYNHTLTQEKYLHRMSRGITSVLFFFVLRIHKKSIIYYKIV